MFCFLCVSFYIGVLKVLLLFWILIVCFDLYLRCGLFGFVLLLGRFLLNVCCVCNCLFWFADLGLGLVVLRDLLLLYVAWLLSWLVECCYFRFSFRLLG